MLVGSLNDKEDRKLIFTSRVLRTKLGKKNHPMLVKNLGRRNVLRKDTSVVQSKKVKGIRDKRLDFLAYCKEYFVHIARVGEGWGTEREASVSRVGGQTGDGWR